MRGQIGTQALANIEKAIAGYIEVAKKLGKPVPVEVTVTMNTAKAGI
ncbi:type II toxin-antitoxin system HicB family antitoxin [Methanoplanus endosymbiosus]|uniref:Type II toxin-antitoxin system HicB family antitoxin n=1 Tax=Methanoplanus endosymbiosus TaxID=33865 RepID=A0A9E7TJZ6_9EURY|nr:type II toxin-antitoxin system HicB family antitoxin [Methanoplanus endosymbiosus]UUX92309.1 type II toxin-antitoxin system HicB family antitoxin [Methanoplanus endosymbiosus]